MFIKTFFLKKNRGRCSLLLDSNKFSQIKKKRKWINVLEMSIFENQKLQIDLKTNSLPQLIIREPRWDGKKLTFQY